MNNANGTSEESSSSGHGLGETDTSESLDLAWRECEELFENEKEWEDHVHGILKDTITKFQSMEGDAKYKYQKLMEVRDLVLNDRKELKAKIQAFEDEKVEMKKINDAVENVVTLNVGGQYYATSRSTLCSDRNSMLAAMFSGLHKIEKLRDGSYLIDASGKHFGIILDYLRGRIMYPNDLPNDKETLLELRRESDFYNLLELKNLVETCLQRFPNDFESWCLNYFALGAAPKSRRDMNFRKCVFTNCCFKSNIFFHKADFEKANLLGTKFEGCKFFQDISFKGACLAGVEFSNCDIASDIVVHFEEADLSDCKFLEKRQFQSLVLSQFGENGIRARITTKSLAKSIDMMSFSNAKNIDKVQMPEGKLPLIKLRTKFNYSKST